MQPFTAEQLKAAVSPETAVVTEDYPYGYRLRCKMRYWLEYRKGHGFRIASQTTNPKKPFEVWNKPKFSTYAKVSAVLYIDGDGHVQTAVLTEYSDLAEIKAFTEQHGEYLNSDARRSAWYYYQLKKVIADKEAELGVENIYNATPEQVTEIRKAYATKLAELRKAGEEW